MKFKITSIVLFVCVANYCFAQPSNTGNWLMYFGNNKIAHKWNLHNEIQYRSYNAISDLEQLLIRGGIGYNISENNNNILLGYGYIASERYVNNSDKVKTEEHRLFQQFITRQNFNRVFIQHRYRIEERFLKNDFKMRFRYFLSLNIPITKKEMVQNAIYLSVYNELFVNNTTPVFDRNRLYGAIGYVINKSFRVEAGYMSQILEKTQRGQFQIGFYNNLSFVKQKQ